jgi:hypothetical protein
VGCAGGVVPTSDGDPDSEPLGVTEGCEDAVEVGDASADAEAVAVDDRAAEADAVEVAAAAAEAVGIGEPVGSAAVAKGLATTLSARAAETALTARLIKAYGEHECCVIAPPGARSFVMIGGPEIASEILAWLSKWLWKGQFDVGVGFRPWAARPADEDLRTPVQVRRS